MCPKCGGTILDLKDLLTSTITAQPIVCNAATLTVCELHPVVVMRNLQAHYTSSICSSGLEACDMGHQKGFCATLL